MGVGVDEPGHERHPGCIDRLVARAAGSTAGPSSLIAPPSARNPTGTPSRIALRNASPIAAAYARLRRWQRTRVRDDLAEVLERRGLTDDAARPEAVERRHAAGARTARENLADLVDPGSFVEYGALAIAAQRDRRELDELLARTPADGLIAGTARVNGELFGERAACAVLSYDYTVLAGTQGAIGHRKKDRLFELIERMRLPDGALRRGRGRAARRHRLRRRLGARHPRLRALGDGSPGWCRGSRSSRAAASPATRCSPAAPT